MFLLFALGLFDLRRTRGASCFADEFAAGGDTAKRDQYCLLATIV